MKIKAKNPKIASMRLCVPVDGVIEINAEGIVEVSSKCAEALVKGTNDWDYLSDETAEETEETEEENSERSQFIDQLSEMSLADMKAMATEGEFPEEEWKKITSKKLMSAYLLKKYDEATAEVKETEGETEEETEE